MSRLFVGMLIAAAGFGLGVAYGRLVSPVEYVGTDPSSLRVDYRSDYVLMVAEGYEVNRDADGALRQLAVLAADSPDRLCAEAIQFARAARYAPEDIELLQDLLRVVQAQTSAAAPHSPSP